MGSAKKKKGGNQGHERERCRAETAKLLKAVSASQAETYAASKRTDVNLTYGELDGKDLCAIMERFCPKETHARVWDLGSGAGSLVLFASLALEGAELCGGVELQEALHAMAVENERRLNEALPDLARRAPTHFVCGDIFETAAAWKDASLVVANVLLFDEATLARFVDVLGATLAAGAYVVTTARFCHSSFAERHAGLWCKASWTGGAQLAIYVRT